MLIFIARPQCDRRRRHSCEFMFVMCCHQILSIKDACYENIDDVMPSFCGCQIENRQEDGNGNRDGAFEGSHNDNGSPEILLVPGPDYFRGPSFFESS